MPNLTSNRTQLLPTRQVSDGKFSGIRIGSTMTTYIFKGPEKDNILHQHKVTSTVMSTDRRQESLPF